MFLPADGFVRTIVGFDINKAMNAVGSNERGAVAIAVFGQTFCRELVTPIYRVP